MVRTQGVYKNAYFAVFWGGIAKSSTAKDENINLFQEAPRQKRLDSKKT